MFTSITSIPKSWQELRPEFFARPAAVVAEDLLGCVLLLKTDKGFIGGPICETEAYDQDEEASHTFRGPNERNASMFKEPGTVYIYRSYGIHWCMNMSTGSKGRGEGVLFRALHATFGAEAMLPGASNSPERICSGPGRLCAALRIGKEWDGSTIGIEGISVWKTDLKETYETVVGSRIGISKAVELHWRFGIRDHPSLSKPFPKEKAPLKTKKTRALKR